jgi:hypothetical protein
MEKLRIRLACTLTYIEGETNTTRFGCPSSIDRYKRQMKSNQPPPAPAAWMSNKISPCLKLRQDLPMAEASEKRRK